MTDTSLLQGEVTENPVAHDLDVEGLLRRFLQALLEEQRAEAADLVPAPPILESSLGKTDVAAELGREVARREALQ